MQIGLDFDGVITDCGKLKSEGAKKIYGVDISPERFKKELVIDKGILTAEQYKHVQSQIYETRELGFLMDPVPGVVEYTDRLHVDGHDLKIITSRGENAGSIALDWMKKQGLVIPMVTVGGGKSKADFCTSLDVYIDDDLDKLEPLVGIVPHRFLFNWGYNQHINEIGVAKRVYSWKDFYTQIREL